MEASGEDSAQGSWGLPAPPSCLPSEHIPLDCVLEQRLPPYPQTLRPPDSLPQGGIPAPLQAGRGPHLGGTDGRDADRPSRLAPHPWLGSYDQRPLSTPALSMGR